MLSFLTAKDQSNRRTMFETFLKMLSLLKYVLNRLSRRAPLDSFINFYCGLNVDGRIVANLRRL